MFHLADKKLRTLVGTEALAYPIDVFISYSHKDTAFVQLLNQTLANSKYNAWDDWENILLLLCN